MSIIADARTHIFQMLLISSTLAPSARRLTMLLLPLPRVLQPPVLKLPHRLPSLQMVQSPEVALRALLLPLLGALLPLRLPQLMRLLGLTPLELCTWPVLWACCLWLGFRRDMLLALALLRARFQDQFEKGQSRVHAILLLSLYVF